MCVQTLPVSISFWRWHHTLQTMAGTPPQHPSRLAVAPNETPPPWESNQSSNRPKPEGLPRHRERKYETASLQPSIHSSIYLQSFGSLCTFKPPYLGCVSGGECVCGHVRGCYACSQLVHSVDGLQKCLLTPGLKMTRELLEEGEASKSLVFTVTIYSFLYLWTTEFNFAHSRSEVKLTTKQELLPYVDKG